MTETNTKTTHKTAWQILYAHLRCSHTFRALSLKLDTGATVKKSRSNIRGKA